MKYIFVCNWGVNRSPTAKKLAKRIAVENGLELEAEHMALFPEESEQYERKEKARLNCADKVVVMTPDMAELVRQRYGLPEEKVVCLNIEDDYDCYGIAGPQMRKMLEAELMPKLKKLMLGVRASEERKT